MIETRHNTDLFSYSVTEVELYNDTVLIARCMSDIKLSKYYKFSYHYDEEEKKIVDRYERAY